MSATAPQADRHGGRRACIGDPGVHRVPARDRRYGRVGHGVRGHGCVHAALRMAWRGTRRRRGGTVRAVGADLICARILRYRPPGWNDCSTNRQTTDRPAVRAAYRPAMHLELAVFDAALPQAEHHRGRAAPRRPIARRPKQTGQRRMTLVPRLRRGTRAQCCTPTCRPRHEVR